MAAYVGIMLNQSILRGIPAGKTSFEKLQFYEEAARQLKLTPCYFRVQDIHSGAGASQQVRAYVKQHNRFVRLTLPLPKVIHNRAFHPNTAASRKIHLLLSRGYRIFNVRNRYSKWRVHRLLMTNKKLRPHLPATQPATVGSIRNMQQQFKSIILKPDNSSIGKGVMKLDHTAGGWMLHFSVKPKGRRRIWRKLRVGSQFPNFLRNKIKHTRYLVQQCIALATYDGAPFDLRVSVQRNQTGNWQITGIVGKVSPKNLFITNVAMGGTVYPLSQLLNDYPELNQKQVEKDIANLALETAKQLGQSLPHLADLGMDIGIRSDGFPFFIECNGRDQRYSFREGNLLHEWKETYANPMRYAQLLLQGKSSANTTSDTSETAAETEGPLLANLFGETPQNQADALQLKAIIPREQQPGENCKRDVSETNEDAQCFTDESVPESPTDDEKAGSSAGNMQISPTDNNTPNTAVGNLPDSRTNGETKSENE